MRDRFGRMRRNFVRRILCVPVLLCAIFVVSSETQASSGSKGARLIIQRAPNFGNDLVIRLSIDGKRVADIPRSQHYGGFLSAGGHVMTVLALPNTELRRPTSIRVKILSGHVYIFTAAWESDRLVLRRSTSYSPTTAVPAAR